MVIAFLIITSFTRPISILQKAVARIAAGDLTHTINSTAKDELGQLSNSFDQMIKQVRLMLGATKGIASSLSAHSHEFHRFSQLTASANTDILKAIHEISSGADEQAMKTESSSVLIAELEAEIRDISAYTYEMKRSSDEAAVGTQQGTASVQALKASTAQSQLLLQKVDAAMQTLSRQLQADRRHRALDHGYFNADECACVECRDRSGKSRRAWPRLLCDRGRSSRAVPANERIVEDDQRYHWDAAGADPRAAALTWSMRVNLR